MGLVQCSLNLRRLSLCVLAWLALNTSSFAAGLIVVSEPTPPDRLVVGRDPPAGQEQEIEGASGYARSGS